MKWLIALYLVLKVANAAECGICFKGRCLAPTPITNESEGLLTTLADIDLNNNILYIRNNEAIKAIQLDSNSVTTIPTARPELTPAFLRVDDVTGDVYYSYGSKPLYRYKPQTNQTATIQQSTSTSMWVHNGTIYWANPNKELNFKTGSSPQQIIDDFKGIKVIKVVFDKFGDMYVGTSVGTVFKKKPNEEKTLLASLAYDVKVDRNGDVYLFDTNIHYLLHQVDLDSDELKIVGVVGKKYHRYTDFMFDKNNNIIAFKGLLKMNAWVHFKDNSEKCTYINTDSIPDIITVSSPNNITTTTTEFPVFGN